jgi:hypothetical protein
VHITAAQKRLDDPKHLFLFLFGQTGKGAAIKGDLDPGPFAGSCQPGRDRLLNLQRDIICRPAGDRILIAEKTLVRTPPVGNEDRDNQGLMGWRHQRKFYG